MKRPRSVLRDEVHTNTGRWSRLPDAEYATKTFSVKATVKGSYPLETLRDPAGADALILVFPLFAYGIPGALMRLLEGYYATPSADEWPRRGEVIVTPQALQSLAMLAKGQ